MDRTLNQTTATIYQFPLRGRFATPTHDALMPSKDVALVDCWYHDEAVREDKKRIQ